MTRVELAPRAATAFIGLLMVFAVGGMVIGALLAGGAHNVAKVQGGSAITYMVSGAVMGVVGAIVLAYARRQLGAVREIVVDERGWTLVDRRGKTVTLAPGATVELLLRCRREVYAFNGIPRIRDVVDGVLRAGATEKRLAPSGPFTYNAALPQLGIHASAPARGHTARYTVLLAV
ncbi:MAG TPA: hypothetical protein VM261_06885 [Kofleriaceae bacterium]|nr:hypothetical protein [Kofleriaceae bacterium]